MAGLLARSYRPRSGQTGNRSPWSCQRIILAFPAASVKRWTIR